jgi:hypothetical protein
MQGPSWDPSALVSNFNTMTLTPPSGEWYADSGAGARMVNNAGILSSLHTPSSSSPSSIIMGNGASLPVTSIGSHSFPTERRPLVLSNVLVSPSIIKNLIYVHHFTTDNNCSIEFDPFGLSVKDLQTRSVIAMCNSTGDLYPFFPIPSSNTTALATTTSSSSLWHHRLGHLGHAALSKLISSHAISCNKHIDDHICHACQLGRHVRLPFSVSNSRAVNPFDLIHCDLWTSPVVSVSGYKYYLVILDDCTHYTWTFPLRLKSETFSVISNFFSYVRTQFDSSIKAVQCDNGREFDHSSARTFFLTHWVILRMSCPYTSQQNGRAERILRTINNIVRSLLFQASLPPVYWADSLHTATYLLNRHPTKTLDGHTPFFALHGTQPSYTHLRVFGCACYPNLSSAAPHKLSPRSSLCVFLGYSLDHKGYRCLDLHSNRIIVSRHVVFNETLFPFSEMSTSPQNPNTLAFLDDADDSSSPIWPRAVTVGTRLPGGMDAAPGTSGAPPSTTSSSSQGGHGHGGQPGRGLGGTTSHGGRGTVTRAVPPPIRLVPLPLRTPRPRLLPVTPDGPPAALSPLLQRRSSPSPMCTACALVARTASGNPWTVSTSARRSRPPLRYHHPFAQLSRTQPGVMLCKPSSTLCRPMTPRPWCLALLASTSLPASGFFVKSSSLMALLTATKLAGSFTGLHSDRALTMMKLSAQL